MSEYRFRKASTRYRLGTSTLDQRARKPNLVGSVLENEDTQNLGGTKTMTTALVKPGDIDAIDSRDLLSSLVDQNLSLIETKNESRERKAWAERQRKDIRERYREKALAAYQKIWDSCSNSAVGHNFETRDVSGRNVKVCSVCSFHASIGGSPHERDLHAKYARGMNEDLVTMMVDRMVELDTEAGILDFPSPSDMPRKKKGFFFDRNVSPKLNGG